MSWVLRCVGGAGGPGEGLVPAGWRPRAGAGCWGWGKGFVGNVRSVEPLRKETLHKIWCYRTALRCPHCRKMQWFDSTKFSQTTPFGRFGAIEPPRFVVSICNGYHSSAAIDSTTFSEWKPFRKFGAIEPRLAVLNVGKCSGSSSPNFLKRLCLENLALSNGPSLLSVFAIHNTAVRFGKIRVIEPLSSCM